MTSEKETKKTVIDEAISAEWKALHWDEFENFSNPIIYSSENVRVFARRVSKRVLKKLREKVDKLPEYSSFLTPTVVEDGMIRKSEVLALLDDDAEKEKKKSSDKS